MSEYSVTKPKGPYPTDLPEVKVGPNEETQVIYGEEAAEAMLIALGNEQATCIKVGNELAEALLEVDRLRAENEKLQRRIHLFKNTRNEQVFEKLMKAHEEIEKLRARLEYAAASIDDAKAWCEAECKRIVFSAAAALKETGDE